MNNEIHFDPDQRHQIETLIKSINNLNQSTKKSNSVVIFLTIILIFLTITIIVISLL